MAFNRVNFSQLSVADGNTPKAFTYRTTDTAATAMGSAYFNDVVSFLTIGDLIYISASDGKVLVYVSAVTPNVTVTELADVASTLTDGYIFVGNAGNEPVGVAMSGDATLANTGALTIANDAITTAKIDDTAVTVAKLATAIQPSHVVKFAGEHTTVGGGAAEAITVTGVAATDLVFAQLKTEGATPRLIETVVPTTNTVTVNFDGDPSNDHVVYYQVLRAIA